LEDNMVDGCSSAPHSQAAQEAIPHLYKQERKRPTLVLRQLSPTQALLGSVIPGVFVPGMNGMYAKNNTHIYVARTSNNIVTAAYRFYCYLLPQREALRTCRSW